VTLFEADAIVMQDTRRAAFLAAYSSPAQNLAALDDIVQVI
jgi:hypothetical protein